VEFSKPLVAWSLTKRVFWGVCSDNMGSAESMGEAHLDAGEDPKRVLAGLGQDALAEKA